jgi:kumamolisin
VAGYADPETGYQIMADGTAQVVGGTSAVAPLWAALIARLAQATGTRFGLMQTALYAGIQPGIDVAGFNDITSGSNGAYSAGPGWDACTGLGSPDGPALLEQLQALNRPAKKTAAPESPVTKIRRTIVRILRRG